MSRMPLPPRDGRCSVSVNSRGLTLIELSVTLAVVAVLSALAVPSYHGLMKRQRVDAAMHLLTSHLASARVSAITYNTPTVVCPSNGDGICRQDSDWSVGWLTFRDPDGNRQPDESIDQYRNDPAPRHPALQILSTAGRRHVRYQPNGLSGGNNLTLRICYDGKVEGLVVVNNTGRIRSSRAQENTPCTP